MSTFIKYNNEGHLYLINIFNKIKLADLKAISRDKKIYKLNISEPKGTMQILC